MRKVSGQQAVGHVVIIDVGQGRFVVACQLQSGSAVKQVFAYCLQGVGLPIHHAAAFGKHVAFHKVFKLPLSRSSLLSAKYAATAYLIQVSGILRRV